MSPKLLFRSFFAAELSAWLQNCRAGRINELKRADWELRRNTRFQPGLRPDDDMTALPPLTEAERAERVALVEQLRRNTLAVRAVAWLLGCGFCQAAWAATICFAMTANEWWQFIPTCLAYAAAAGQLGEWLVGVGNWAAGPSKQSTPCSGLR